MELDIAIRSIIFPLSDYIPRTGSINCQPQHCFVGPYYVTVTLLWGCVGSSSASPIIKIPERYINVIHAWLLFVMTMQSNMHRGELHKCSECNVHVITYYECQLTWNEKHKREVCILKVIRNKQVTKWIWWFLYVSPNRLLRTARNCIYMGHDYIQWNPIMHKILRPKLQNMKLLRRPMTES